MRGKKQHIDWLNALLVRTVSKKSDKYRLGELIDDLPIQHTLPKGYEKSFYKQMFGIKTVKGIFFKKLIIGAFTGVVLVTIPVIWHKSKENKIAKENTFMEYKQEEDSIAVTLPITAELIIEEPKSVVQEDEFKPAEKKVAAEEIDLKIVAIKEEPERRDTSLLKEVKVHLEVVEDKNDRVVKEVNAKRERKSNCEFPTDYKIAFKKESRLLLESSYLVIEELVADLQACDNDYSIYIYHAIRRHHIFFTNKKLEQQRHTKIKIQLFKRGVKGKVYMRRIKEKDLENNILKDEPDMIVVKVHKKEVYHSNMAPKSVFD